MIRFLWRENTMNVSDVTIDDLNAATVVTHWSYRQRRMIGEINMLIRWSLISSKSEEAKNQGDYLRLQTNYAKQAGRKDRGDNHTMVAVKLKDGTNVHVMFSDWNLYVAENSASSNDY